MRFPLRHSIPTQDAAASDTTQVAADSAQAVADSTQLADSTAALQLDSLLTPQKPDTVASDAIGNLSREVGEAGKLLIQGEWEAVLDKLYDSFLDLFVQFIPTFLTSLFVFLVFYAIYRIVASILSRVLDRNKNIDTGLKSLLFKVFKIVSHIFIIIMVVANFGINVTALLTGLGIAGIAVGLAARDTLENFISGLTIIFDAPFRVGDNVVVDGTFGTVDEITLRSTRLRTLNNEIMVMPNTQMINQKVINHTMKGILRIEIPFGIAYKEYPQEAREVVLGLTEGDDRLHPSFDPTVVVTALNDSSVDMVLRLFLNNPKQEIPIKAEYTERVFNALKAADIEIPFPHLQLFIDEAQAFASSPLLFPLPREADDASPDENADTSDSED